jgi:Mor family transcriptional regulator
VSDLPPNDQDELFGIDAENNDIFGHIDSALLDHKHRWPRELVELYDISKAEIIRAGYADDEAGAIAARVMIALSFRSGGRGFYLPKGDTIKQAIRDKQLYDAFNGKNIPALVERYGLSEQQVYKVIAQQKVLQRKKVQPGLFD